MPISHDTLVFLKHAARGVLLEHETDCQVDACQYHVQLTAELAVDLGVEISDLVELALRMRRVEKRHGLTRSPIDVAAVVRQAQAEWAIDAN